MKVSGFTLIRNAIIYDYPIVESIQSLLPLCDEVVVAVGRSKDETLQLIQSIPSSKIRIVETEWDDTLREGGRVLALETDKAFSSIAKDSDWAFYLQGDEVLHEKYIEIVRQTLTSYLNNPDVEGLLFDYLHFYGSYNYVGESFRWYRKEIRIIRNRADIFSYKDAQGFRKLPNDKLAVKPVNACLYHYGWVKDPRKMQKKQEDFIRLWKDDNWVDNNVAKADEFDYSNVDSLYLFKETHPKVMVNRITEKNWQFDYDLSKNQYSWKERLKRLILKVTGFRVGEYKNYKII